MKPYSSSLPILLVFAMASPNKVIGQQVELANLFEQPTSQVLHNGSDDEEFEVDVPFKQIQVQTHRNGFAFTLTCRTEPERFDMMLPVFKLIMAGFVIKP